MDTPKTLPWSQRLSYGVGHALNDLTASMWYSYLIIYLQLVLGFDSNYAGFVLLIGLVADAVATPLLGIDASNFNKEETACIKHYGRRKFLHLVGTILVIISFPFIFITCESLAKTSEFALTVMIVPLVIIFQIGWAAVQVSHLSLIPAITPYERERDFLNVIRYAVDIVSDISTYIVVWCVFDLLRNPDGLPHTISKEYADKFMLIVIIIVCIGTFFSAIFHIGVKENPAPLDSEETTLGNRANVKKKSLSLKTVSLTWTGWLKEIKFYQVSLLYMCTRLFQNMSCVFMPLYLQEALKSEDDFIAKIPLIMNISGFVISCLMPKLFQLFNKRIVFVIGAAIGIISCIWVAVGHGENYATREIYGVGIMMGAASSMLVVCGLSFIHDLIGTSVESAAFVYGCMSFWDKMANGIAGMFIQYFQSILCKNCNWFYKNVMSYGVGGSAVIACIMLFTLNRSSTKSKEPESKDESIALTEEDITTYGALEESENSCNI